MPECPHQLEALVNHVDLSKDCVTVKYPLMAWTICIRDYWFSSYSYEVLGSMGSTTLVLMTNGFLDINLDLLLFIYVSMKAISEHMEKTIKYLGLDKLDSNESLAFVEEKTKLRPSQIAMALITLALILLVITEASDIVTAVCCFMIPAYLSFLALEAHNPQDDVKFITYWVVFSLTECLQPIFTFLIGEMSTALLRVIFTMLLLYPQLNFSEKLYFTYVEPFMRRHEDQIDRKAYQIREAARSKVNDLKSAASEKVENIVQNVSGAVGNSATKAVQNVSGAVGNSATKAATSASEKKNA